MTTPSTADSHAELVLGSEYACNNGQSRFVVKSCKAVYTFETCEVQYLNSAAPNGLGAKVDVRREAVEASLKGCTVGGKPVDTTDAPKGEAAQALWLGTWYDVQVLGRSSGKVHVRFSSGNEDWLDSSRVRTAVPRSDSAKSAPGTLPEGRYACMGRIGNQLINFGFVEIKGQTYRGPGQSSAGAFAPFSVSADGAIAWSRGFGEFDNNGAHYESASVVAADKPRFTVRYRTASGRAENLDCGRE